MENLFQELIAKGHTFEEAVEIVYKALQESKSRPQVVGLTEFTAIVRYNRGLGVEYRNLSNVHAFGIEEAKEKAWKEAEKVLSDEKALTIHEVRVRPKGY